MSSGGDLYDFIFTDYKNKFKQTLYSVKTIVIKTLSRFEEFNDKDIENLTNLLNAWEANFVSTAFESYH